MPLTDESRARLWKIVTGPLAVLAYGIAFLLLALALRATGLFPQLAAFLSFSQSAERIATLVFLVGLGFAAFLWWLCSRYFALLRSAGGDAASSIAALKDLPLALPEGTVRAIIALIVGVTGLPLLIYAKTLGLSDAIAGYVNGIVIGVFSYYFGTRSSGADAQTTRQTVKLLDQAQAAKAALEGRVGDLGGEVARAQTALESHEQRSKLGAELQRLQNHVTGARALLENFGAVLPAGLIPDSAAAALHKAEEALGAAQALEAGGVTPATLAQVADAAEGLIGKSPVLSLLKTAAGALPAIGGLTPITALALVLGGGWRLGADQYRRWTARVLDAPYDPQLISLGRISPTSAAIALEQCPIFVHAFAAERAQPAFVSELLALALSDDGVEKLWSRYGADARRFASRGQLDEGLTEFRRALLWDQSAGDLGAAEIEATLAPLAGSPLAAASPPSPEQVETLLHAVARPAATAEQQSALEALVMWVGQMRQAKLDPVELIRGIWRP